MRKIFYSNRIFKLSACCLAMLLFLVNTASAQSQEIKFSQAKITLQEAIKQIEEQSNLSVAYNEADVNLEKQVEVSTAAQNLSNALSSIFAGSKIDYQINGSRILLVKSTQAPVSSAKMNYAGQVVDQSGMPLIGVTVILNDNQTVGTATDADGRFSMNVPQNSVATVSYIGYVSQEITFASQTEILVTLAEETVNVSSVVVTALGIKRDEKALTYNVQAVEGDDVIAVADPNFVNGLQGKVTGVTINQSASGIGGSSRVVMRGPKSLFGNNNAMYVVDGVPMSSRKSAQSSQTHEVPDGGDYDGISSLNPEDIESVSVLTGAAAAALYGTSGANGVVMITTKKGKEGKTELAYTNNTHFLSPFVMPKFQNSYGSMPGSAYSWGEKMATPSSFEPTDFFQTGYNEVNSLSLSTGKDRSQTYISAASTNSRGVVPNTEYNKYNVGFRNNAEIIEDKLFADLSASYTRNTTQNMMSQGDYHNPLRPLYLFPRGDNFDNYRAYERYNPETNFNTQFWPYMNSFNGNPFWIVNREMTGNKRDRYIFSGNFRYEPADWINVTARAKYDSSSDLYERKMYASTSLLFASKYGNYLNMQMNDKNVYGDFIVNIKKECDNWGFNLNVGASLLDQQGTETVVEGHLARVVNLFTIDNLDKQGPEHITTQQNYRERNNAVFGTLQFSVLNSIFLDVTGRNDWFSTLAYTSSEKSGFFYPSVGLSAVMTDLFNVPYTSPLSLLKVRASYSEVGNAPDRYLTTLTYPVINGSLDLQPYIPATNLKPERTKSFEAGVNLSLFKNAITLDVTYYNSNTYNQFFNIEMPSSTKYSRAYINGGQVNNWGLEASIGGRVTAGDFKWNTNLNFSMNRNKIVELIPEGTKYPTTDELINITEFNAVQQPSYKMTLKEGGTMGDIYVTGLETDHQGYVKVNPQTGEVKGDDKTWIYAGSAMPDCNLGWNNTFSYKGISLSALVTARIGGVGISATQAEMDRFGVSETTAVERNNGGTPINNGTVNTQQYYTVASNYYASNYVYSMTNVRLQELTLGYTLPNRWFGNIVKDVNVSFVGKNLFMFYNEAPFDPELTASTSTYYQGFDYFMMPSLRTLGFNVKFKF